MDLLKNLQSLHLSDDKKWAEQYAPTPPPTAAATASHSVPKHESLLHKIGDAVLGGDHKPTPAPVVAAPPSLKKEDSLFDKLGDALGGSKHTATPPPPPVAVPEPRTTDKLFSKLEETLTGKQAPPPAPTVAVPEQRTTDKLLSKLEETLTGKQATPPPPAPKKEENLLNKIGDKLTGRKTPPPPPKEEHLIGKLVNVVTGKKEEPQKPHGIAEKINYALGGGAKGEAKEDKLDKAIDLFQEHVLKQGDQSNESALEQAKDKQIADAIRHAVGRPKTPKS
ncbi:hypothetical protein M413DRAFT_438822 [Hebeloma cylindrosporum]|uniref:Uncharacterized protein n=1 Tax=Hebeloma cylindrosporum TaxID=76867 RepID=A0A0C2Z951_HEBCY|nr:hypothetical protein M413DRAFT_438822 [Hebeloma cylindrosporum h7]